jgi:iron complex outermembrane receptor protein
MSPLSASRGALGAVFALAAGTAAGQPASLPAVTITGNPLTAPDTIAPASQLSGTSLLLRSRGTLGETLDGLPGVSSTYFGPNASRPVIRGLDGDRIRVLQNGGTALDAASLSYDHAVAADPIALERIEVLRGPAALLYGGNALGGVVNMIDNRIPREPVGGVFGKADLGFASGAGERSGAVLVEGGTQRVGLHVDMFRRDQGETRVPQQLACTQGGVTRNAPRICNSAADADGGALGGALFFDGGRVGLSTSRYRSTYGAVAEDEVTIRMRSDRHAFEGDFRPDGWLQSVQVRGGHSDYAHTELDAGVAGTEFRQRGNDLRVTARHAPLGALEGVVGLQAESARFEAIGAEAFAPPSRTRQVALFLHEEWAMPWGKWSFGARGERVEVRAESVPGVARFAAARRSFHPGSASVGALWKLAPGWEATGSAAVSERAPKDYELFANGPHVATGAYEVGNPAAGKERSRHVEAGLQWKDGPHRAFRLNAYASRFSNYIALLPTGLQRDADGNGAGTGATGCGDGTSAESGCSAELLPEFAYRGVRADFRGLEASGNTRVWQAGGHTVDLEARADLVRASNRTLGEPLPRIAPARLGLTAAWGHGAWSVRVGADHHARQSRVPAGELATPGFTLWHAAATWRASVGGASLLWYARLDNAADRLAYSASSILTQSAPGRVPLPGRSVKVGVQASF